MLRRAPAAVVALVLLGAPALAADAKLGGDLYSAYVWRGITFADSPVFQPTVEVSGLRLGQVPMTVNAWGNFNLGDWDGKVQRYEFSEVDFTVTAALPRGFTLGYIEYVFTVGEPSTREFNAGWSHAFRFATPSLTFYYDVKEIESGFLLLALDRRVPVGGKAALTLRAETGVAARGFARYYGGEKGGFYHYGLTGTLAYPLGARGSLRGTVAWMDGFDHAILPKQDAPFYAGLSASYAF